MVYYLFLSSFLSSYSEKGYPSRVERAKLEAIRWKPRGAGVSHLSKKLRSCVVHLIPVWVQRFGFLMAKAYSC